MHPVPSLACSLLTLSSLHAPPTGLVRTHGPQVGIPVCTAPGWRVSQQVVPDGRQGAILAWYDSRGPAPATSLDIYAQRINADGTAKWARDGVLLCDAPGQQYNVSLAADGSGGAVAAWTDSRGPDQQVYAQRVDARGTTLWAHNGVSAAPQVEGVTPIIAGDGFGGAYIVWESDRVVCAQHVDATGNLLWGPAGLPLSYWALELHGPRLAFDGADGVYFIWNDYGSEGSRVYAQHVSSDGRLLWSEKGIRICTVESTQRRASVTSDGDGGAIIAWKDGRRGGADAFGVFAQRVGALGDLQWNPQGVDLSANALTDERYPAIVSDAEGAIVAWHDRRAGAHDIWAQRVNLSGNDLWGPNGLPLCVADGEQTSPGLASDEDGGAIAAWSDDRSTDPGYYAQRIDASGKLAWGSSGALVTTHGLAGWFWPIITSDGRGGAFVAWTVFGIGITDTPIYVQRLARGAEAANVRSEGQSSSTVTSLDLDRAGARFGVESTDLGEFSAQVYDLSGRRIRDLTISGLRPGNSAITWDGRDQSGRRVIPGVYFVRIRSTRGAHTLRTVLLR